MGAVSFPDGNQRSKMRDSSIKAFTIYQLTTALYIYPYFQLFKYPQVSILKNSDNFIKYITARNNDKIVQVPEITLYI